MKYTYIYIYIVHVISDQYRVIAVAVKLKIHPKNVSTITVQGFTKLSLASHLENLCFWDLPFGHLFRANSADSQIGCNKCLNQDVFDGMHSRIPKGAHDDSRWSCCLRGDYIFYLAALYIGSKMDT